VTRYGGPPLTTRYRVDSGITDSLVFSVWPAAATSSGTELSVRPASVTNTNATISFAQVTASWGTVVVWGIYDAVTAGDLMCRDYLGNYKWVPFTCTSASAGVMTTDSTTDAPAMVAPSLSLQSLAARCQPRADPGLAF
jgi:hypothetical protein